MKSPWYVFWLIVLCAIPIDMTLEAFKISLFDPPAPKRVTVLKAQPMLIIGVPMTRADQTEDSICTKDEAPDTFDSPTTP